MNITKRCGEFDAVMILLSQTELEAVLKTFAASSVNKTVIMFISVYIVFYNVLHV